MKFCVRQRLSQAIGNHLISGHVSEVDFSSSYLVPDVVVLDVDMLHLRVKDRVVGGSNGALIVSSQRDCIGNEV